MSNEIINLLEKILKKQDRIDYKLTELLNKRAKKTWTRPGFISDLTGWSGEKLRQAREQKIIEYRKAESGGLEYMVESLPKEFIKKYTSTWKFWT